MWVNERTRIRKILILFPFPLSLTRWAHQNVIRIIVKIPFIFFLFRISCLLHSFTEISFCLLAWFPLFSLISSVGDTFIAQKEEWDEKESSWEYKKQMWSQTIQETATNYFAVHQSIIDQLILVKLELESYMCNACVYMCMNYFIIG